MAGPRDTDTTAAGRRPREISASVLSAWFEAEAAYGTRFCFLGETAQQGFREHVRWLLEVREEACRLREARRLAREERWRDVRDGLRPPMTTDSLEFAELHLDIRASKRMRPSDERELAAAA